jgi:hypothetical protein
MNFYITTWCLVFVSPSWPCCDEKTFYLCLIWFGVQYTSAFRSLPRPIYASTLSPEEDTTADSMDGKTTA